MKWLLALLTVLLLGLQWRLWVGDGSLSTVVRLNQQIEKQSVENQRLKDRNDVLASEVANLKSGLNAVEAKAREDLGLIKPGETFFMVVEPEQTSH